MLGLFCPILESLESIVDAHEPNRIKAYSIIAMLMSFEFVFVAHLVWSIFGLTNSLNLSLKKKDQDIVNAMILVDRIKADLQELRYNGWEDHLTFMAEYDCDIPNMEDLYVSHMNRGRRMVR